MQPTISESEVISKFRVLLADKPQDVQLKVLWLLLEAIAADIDQIKAYTDAFNLGIANYTDTVKSYSVTNAPLAEKLAREAEKLLDELG